MINSSWDICHFLPFNHSLLETRKIRILKKWNKLRYGSWDTESDNFLSFWAIFCSFTPQTTWKIKIKKKCMEISSFYTCLPQMTIIWCMFPEIWSVADIIVYYFGLFFALLPLNSPKNPKKKKKMKKSLWRYHHFTQMYQKLWSYVILFLSYDVWWV